MHQCGPVRQTPVAEYQLRGPNTWDCITYRPPTSCLLGRPTVPLVNVARSYVKAFWEENNDYKGMHGHMRPPPKRGGYTMNNTRKIRREVHRPSEIKRIRHRGFDQMMETPSGRIHIMKKYLEKSPFLAECI